MNTSLSAEDKTYADTILILDASGSMWGQIDGVNKIVIARDVVEGLVRSLPDERRLGLVAYGHREKGDCNDIQTIADVGANRDDLIKSVQTLSPKGKTPLTKSVEHAAIALDYQQQAANVILVSDGLETCAADPCALAKTLEENGLDFTVHVIGFDVTEEERAGLQCIADETGGEFLAAGNTEELGAALSQVAVAEPTPAETTGESESRSPLFMKATILSGGPQIQKDIQWTLKNAAGDEILTSDQPYVETDVAPGEYTAEAIWSGWRKGHPDAGDPKRGTLTFSVLAAQTKVVTVPVDLNLPVELNVTESTTEGVPVEVSWSGPDDLGGFVSVAAKDDGPREMIYFFATQKTRTAFAKGKEIGEIDTDQDGDFDQDDQAVSQLGAPSIAGEYEVRYVLGDPRLILARRPLTVTDSDYSLSVPEQVAASSTFDIDWQGPLTAGDFVTLIEAGSETVFQNGVTAKLVEGKVASLTAPAVPGEYEVRYILANGYTTYPGMQTVVQATAPITVTAVEASVEAPGTAVGGSTIEVSWIGPADEKGDDYISVIAVGAEKFNRDSWSRLYKANAPINPAPIRVPAIEGDYEIAYVLQPGNRIIARRPLSITRASASLSAPASVSVGATIEVQYTGDAFKGDRVVLCPADTPDEKMWQWGGNYGFFVSENEGQGTVAARLTAKAGDYELRYVTGLQHQVLARTIVTIE